MKKIALAVTLAALSVAAARPAAAAVYVTTWTGTLVNGLDRTGEFGRLGRTLDGLAFSAVFTLDDAAPGVRTTLTANSSTIEGIGAQGVTAGVTIDGHTLQFGRAATPDFEVSTGGAREFFQPNYNFFHEEVRGGFRDNSYISADVQSTTVHFLTSPNFRTPFVASGPGLTFAGGFSVNNNALGHVAYSDFLITRVETVLRPQAGAVPEPSSWALMIVGFGAAGAMLRRRRGAAFAAP